MKNPANAFVRWVVNSFIMKLRIRGNSIRLRLSRGEVEQFANDEPVAEVVDFGTRRLTYALEWSENGTVDALFDGERIAVRIPKANGLDWALSDQVSVSAETGDLRILIEKDFACLSPRPGEDESDMFENPSAEACAG